MLPFYLLEGEVGGTGRGFDGVYLSGPLLFLPVPHAKRENVCYARQYFPFLLCSISVEIRGKVAHCQHTL